MGIELAAAGIGAAAAMGDYKRQKAAAKATKAYNARVVEGMVDNYHQLAGAEVDTLDASYDNSLSAQIQYLQAKSKAQNAAAASGVAGGSVDMLLGELSRQKDASMGAIIQNREAAFADINSQAKAIRSGANSNLRAIKKPSAGAAIMKGIQTGLSVYSMGSSAMASVAAAKAANAAATASTATQATTSAMQSAASSVGTNSYRYNFLTNSSPVRLA